MTGSQTLEVPGYDVVQFLGTGARSTIWQIRDRQTDQSYALKRVVKRNNGDEKFLAQAVSEYEIGSRLDHPHLRKIHSIRRVKRWLSVKEIHLVMELCEGKTVQESRPREVPAVLEVFSQVASALTYMNGTGFVHADMKPNNIVVDSTGRVKIIDLGQSCPLGTVKERIQGTPDFIAPEQVYRRPLDARTDVFNFGAALYWTLTGKAIPTVLPKQDSLTMVKDMVVKPPEELNPDVPASLSKLITDCIEVHPSHRPENMKTVNSRLGLIAHTFKRNHAERD